MDNFIEAILRMALEAEKADARRQYEQRMAGQRVIMEFYPIVDGCTAAIPDNEESVLVRYVDESEEDSYEVLTFYKAGTEVTQGYKNIGSTPEERLLNLLTNDACKVTMKIEKTGFYVWEPDEKDPNLNRPRLIGIDNISHWARLPKTKSKEE